MKEIQKEVFPECLPEEAFKKFVDELSGWWPGEYTWSGKKLVDIRINAQKGGLCTETGPYGFRCDWGRVIETGSRHILFKWQISPKRVPEPDPERASEIEVHFHPADDGRTRVVFIHRDFEKHGEQAAEYREAMDSAYGWDYILNCYIDYCRVPA